MWVRRNDREIARWHKITQRDAKSHALSMACVVGLLAVLLAAGGWVFNSRAGIVARNDVVRNSWTRFAVIVALAVPVSYWLYRREVRNELGKSLRRTICPTCGTAGESLPGTICQCGDAFVPQSEMKWVEG